jgi:hypothetical protein
MNHIEEQHRALAHALTNPGLGDGGPDLSHPRAHGGERDQVGRLGTGQKLGDRGLAASGRADQHHRWQRTTGQRHPQGAFPAD